MKKLHIAEHLAAIFAAILLLIVVTISVYGIGTVNASRGFYYHAGSNVAQPKYDPTMDAFNWVLVSDNMDWVTDHTRTIGVDAVSIADTEVGRLAAHTFRRNTNEALPNDYKLVPNPTRLHVQAWGLGLAAAFSLLFLVIGIPWGINSTIAFLKGLPRHREASHA